MTDAELIAALRTLAAEFRSALKNGAMALATKEFYEKHHRPRIEACEAAASRLEALTAGGWRPIETAPHGVEVLLATPPFKSMGESARWELRVGCAAWGEVIGGVSNRSYDSWATAWLPLPPPPATDEVQ